MLMSQSLRVNLGVSLIAGALAPLALAPTNFWPLALLSVALLWYSLNHTNTAKQAVLSGFVYGLGYFGVGVSWVFVSMVDHSDTHWMLATLLTALFCGGMALFLSLIHI